MILSELLTWATDYLKENKIEDARLEAEILLSYALRISRAQLITQSDKIIEDIRKIKDLLKRRAKHEPTAYITGVQPFMSLNFFVNRSVLIPRPETELLVEEAIKLYPKLVVDVGTGSGCIAISLAKALPNSKVIGIDSSSEALKVAVKNAKYHKVADRCQFIKGNLLLPHKEKVELIISNPPYIPSAEIEKLQPEVRDWEPREALDGGKDGLDYIRQIIKAAPDHLKPNGILLLEFGVNQAGDIQRTAKSYFSKTRIIKDL